MPKIDWRAFLNRWNHIVNKSPGLTQGLPNEVNSTGFLGQPGAPDEQISQAEARLGIQLPPSYRAFLQVSDGWFTGTDATSRLFPIQETDWFAVRFPDVLQGWLTGFQMQGEPEPVPEKEYRVYGETQDPSLVRSEDLQASLVIGIGADESFYLLNPRLIDRGGEWEAWFFAAWLPGAKRYSSFGELMQAEYQKVKDWVEEEKEHVRSVRLSGGMKASLPSLLAEFQKEIAKQSQVASGASWIDAPYVQYVRGIIEGLQYGELRVRQIQEQAHDLEEVQPALEALTAELENRWQQSNRAAKQEGQMDMVEQMRLYSAVEGSRQAMGIVQWFLKEHKML
ncbi:hypothetical protein LARV_01370 [Longilinea arvoryzae]|uniref:Knr4/Smi1-like domain-containing protein n=1 Tax=Longilinea arvoryzae TaxID=360412 RepID=A0A0S7B825_9CHLR|nr:SMI1/KNR4 family protein [Longilinea arvoryzae]GAP13615.1 hypothetical protein LARV_01370 [Longilinea arvoryzae]